MLIRYLPVSRWALLVLLAALLMPNLAGADILTNEQGQQRREYEREQALLHPRTQDCHFRVRGLGAAAGYQFYYRPSDNTKELGTQLVEGTTYTVPNTPEHAQFMCIMAQNVKTKAVQEVTRFTATYLNNFILRDKKHQRQAISMAAANVPLNFWFIIKGVQQDKVQFEIIDRSTGKKAGNGLSGLRWPRWPELPLLVVAVSALALLAWQKRLLAKPQFLPN